MVNCSAKSCSNSSKDTEKHRWLSFPKTGPLLQAWKTAAGQEEGWSPKRTSVICEAHFTPDCWDPLNPGSLVKGCVPTVFCTCKESVDSGTPGTHSRLPLRDVNREIPNTPRRPVPAILRRERHDNAENIVGTVVTNRGRPRKSVKEHSVGCPFHRFNHHASSYAPPPISPASSDLPSPSTVNRSSPLVSTQTPPISAASPVSCLNRSSPVSQISATSSDWPSATSLNEISPLVLTQTPTTLPPSPSPSFVNRSSPLVSISSETSSNLVGSPHMSPLTLESSNDHLYSRTPFAPFQIHSNSSGSFSSEKSFRDPATSTSQDRICPTPTVSSLTDVTTSAGRAETHNVPDVAVIDSSSQPSYAELLQKVEKLDKIAKQLTSRIYHLERQKDKHRLESYRWSRRYTALQKNLSARFGDDQLRALALNQSRGLKWSDRTLEMGHKVHFACGSSGYNAVRQLQMPLPSIRTLQENLQCFKIRPGVFDQVFDLVKLRINQLPILHRNSIIAFDELAIEKRFELDPNTGSMIGKCTLPVQLPKVTQLMKTQVGNDPEKLLEHRLNLQRASLDENADKALNYVLGSLVGRRWKHIAGFDLTGKSIDGKRLKERLLELTQISHATGFIVRAWLCDMGNASLFKELGIRGGEGECINYIEHPVLPGEKLFVTPDSVHVFKNLFVMMATHGSVSLPLDFVEENELPTRTAEFSDIVLLQSYQQDMRWKLAPKLHGTDLVGGHFRKMKVNNATRVINYRTYSALIFLSVVLNRPSMRTTAFFMLIMHKWFKIMTGRTPLWALGKKNLEAYEDALNTLKIAFHLFENIRFGSQHGCWKPCQTGGKLCTKTVLDLVDLLVEKMGASMFFAGLLTQDFVENTHSQVRAVRPNPTPRQYKDRLRELIVGGFMGKVAGSSYEWDDRVSLVSFLHAQREKQMNENQEEATFLPKDSSGDLEILSLPVSDKPISEKEKPAFYFVSGYVVHKVLEEHTDIRGCSDCHTSLLHQGPDLHKYGLFTHLASFSTGLLQAVSEEVFQLFLHAEEEILKNKSAYDLQDPNGISRFRQTITDVRNNSLPTCHNLATVLLERFFLMRTRLGFENILENSAKKITSQMSSKTMGANYLAACQK